MASGRHPLARLIARQQAAAIVATAADYVVMTACVRARGMTPPIATAIGALVGTFVGFVCSRRWVFRSGDRSAAAQAVRYFAVSAMSLVLNSAGEGLLVGLGMNYLVARPFVSIGVSLGWNLPLQTWFVFAARGQPSASGTRGRFDGKASREPASL